MEYNPLILYMSLASFKKKSVSLYGTNISGKGAQGFSINGTVRSNTYIGKNCIMSSAGTPMTGIYPQGYGGLRGRYPHYVMFNVYPDSAIGNTSPVPYKSVLTTRGMLHTRFKCIYDGTYPNNVVKNVYTGDMVDNVSQGVYLEKKDSANMCVMDANNRTKYSGGGERCLLESGIKKTYPGANVGGYFKPPVGAIDSDTYLQYIKKNCSNKDTHIPRPVYRANRVC